MAEVTLGGQEVILHGKIPKVGDNAPNFKVVGLDLSTICLDNYIGKRVILNIFPSIDTNVCAASTRVFNERIVPLENTIVLCISRDLPFAQNRFVTAEKLEHITMLSDFRERKLGKDYGIEISNGPFTDLLTRAIFVLNENHTILYKEIVTEISNNPDYDAAINALQ